MAGTAGNSFRTGDIQLDHVDVGFGKACRDGGVFLDRFPDDIGDNRETGNRPQRGELVADPGFHPDVLKPDGVQHPAIGFGDPERFMGISSFG